MEEIKDCIAKAGAIASMQDPTIKLGAFKIILAKLLDSKNVFFR